MDEVRMHPSRQSTVSHALRLPAELVAEIFKFYPDMRLTFCQICSMWREIAISTPMLWTTVQIAMFDDRFDGQMLWLQTSCNRAGMRPLSIRLDRGNFMANNEQSPITTLVPYFPRIQHLTLSLSAKCCQSLSDLPMISMPFLESCSFSCTHIIDTQCRITVFETAQRLRTVSISGPSCVNILRLPSMVADLRLDCDLGPAICLDVLQQCPNLESLTGNSYGIRLQSSSEGDQFPDNALLLPRLKTILITFDDAEGLELLFGLIVVPALINLDMIFTRSPWLQPRFISLLTQSACNLQKFSLSGSDMNGDEFLECLRALPSLVHCHIRDVQFIYGWVLDALVYSEGGSNNLVPRLETFAAQSFTESKPAIRKSFMDMVESRWWLDHALHRHRGCSRLSFAKLEFNCPVIDLDVWRRESRLRQQGLAVYVE
jgi:hypothetical protein